MYYHTRGRCATLGAAEFRAVNINNLLFSREYYVFQRSEGRELQ